MGNKDFSVYINRDHWFRITLTSGSEAYNLSGASEVTLTTKQSEDMNLTGFNKTISGGGLIYSEGGDGSSGLLDLDIDPADTSGAKDGMWVYDVKVELAGDVTCPLKGNLELKKTVSG